MSHVLARCRPETDAGFQERVRTLTTRETWDLASAEGVALMQAVLRATYPLATVAEYDGVWSGGQRRTTVVEVDRDGLIREPVLDRHDRLYAHSGHAAYRAAAEIVGEGAVAERVVGAAFGEVREALDDGSPIDAAGAAVVEAARRLAHQAQPREGVDGNDGVGVESTASGWADASILRRGVRTVLHGQAVQRLRSAQREALELAVLEDLKVSAIAERTQATPTQVHARLRDGILALRSEATPSPADTLRRWRAAEEARATLAPDEPTRWARTVEVAHAWLDYQVAARAIPDGSVVLITDRDRRFVAASAGAGDLMGRGSVVGLHIEDVTAPYARALVPELWTIFDADGAMHGAYDCDRPGQEPVRVSFRGVWGRPAPDLQVGVLGPPEGARAS